MKSILALLAILVLAVACSGNEPTNTTNNTAGTPTGQVIGGGNGDDAGDQEIATAPQQDTTPQDIENTADNDDQNSDDARTPTTQELRQCQEAINYNTLIEALPESQGGFARQGDPDGTTLSWNDPAEPQKTVRYSTASETLANDDATIVISLLDTCYVQYLNEGWSRFVEYDGTEGSMKRIEVAGYPGWKQFDKSTNTYTINVLVENRVFVTVQGSEGVSDAQLEAAAAAVDYSKIKSEI